MSTELTCPCLCVSWHSIVNALLREMSTILKTISRDLFCRFNPVSKNFCIHLLGSTKIIAVENDVMIPAHIFEFMELGDLYRECNKYINDEILEFAIGRNIFHIYILILYSHLYQINTFSVHLHPFLLGFLDVGVIEEFEKAKQITTKYGERDIVRFKITEGRLAYSIHHIA